MFNLKLLLLLTLISFSIQDSNCLITYDECDWEPTTKRAEKISNCAYEFVYVGETYCFECQKDYALSGDKKKCISFENCRYLDSEDKLCSKCVDGYVLSNGGSKCIPFPHCDYLEDDTEKCGRCEDGYALSYDQKECKSFEGCEQLAEGDNKCSRCQLYYHNNTEGKCERTLCLYYDDNDVCAICIDGYYLNQNKVCEKINITYCLKVSDNDPNECIQCIEGLPSPVNKKCVVPETLVKGCKEYNNNGKCTTCVSDYKFIPENNNCEFEGCTKGEKKNEYCLICKVGFYDEDDLCISYKDGSKDTSANAANINKIKNALVFLILAFLI